MEIWRAIPHFKGYEASDLGNLRSLDYKRSKRIVVLKPAIGPDGYPQTMLKCEDGKYKTWKVHKWICLTFLGENKGLEVNHRNGIKTDNRILNLEYCTRSQNIQHSFDTGLQKPKRGTLNGMAKLNELQVKEIRQYVSGFVGRYYGRKALAKKYNVSEAHIKDIVNNRNSWPHVWN